MLKSFLLFVSIANLFQSSFAWSAETTAVIASKAARLQRTFMLVLPSVDDETTRALGKLVDISNPIKLLRGESQMYSSLIPGDKLKIESIPVVLEDDKIRALLTKSSMSDSLSGVQPRGKSSAWHRVLAIMPSADRSTKKVMVNGVNIVTPYLTPQSDLDAHEIYINAYDIKAEE